jgi:glutaminyl-peptide cyclotransferase
LPKTTFPLEEVLRVVFRVIALLKRRRLTEMEFAFTRWSVISAIVSTLLLAGCGQVAAPKVDSAATSSTKSAASGGSRASAPPLTAPDGQTNPAEVAPPASQTGGFDGAAAYDFAAKLVAFGPRPPDTDAIRRSQDYILSELKAFGCPYSVDDFHASTPIGRLAMRNIITKIPGSGRGIILLLTHYDTVRIPDFVGADDPGSSSGFMLEMARQLCGRKTVEPNSVWITFLDGEEAQVVENGVAQWSDSDSVFGSRELAASMEVNGDLKRVRAVLLADMVGAKELKIKKDPNSTPWITGLVWRTAVRLGYADIFENASNDGVQDDHTPFINRHVPAADVTQFPNYPYWHTTQDTLDKLSPRSFGIVGHVFVETLRTLQQKSTDSSAQ